MKWGLMAAGSDHFCFLNAGTEVSACFDVMTIVNLSLLLVFALGVIVGACALSIWQKRKDAPQAKSRSSQSGNVFFALFAAVGMVGVLGAGMSTVMRGPVTSMATVTKRTIAENNVIASGKLAIVSAATQQPDSGDCDADSFVEPIPFRDAGGSPHPAGGGYIPTTIGASMTDPWQIQYGYCAWDHGAVTVSDNDAGCGGSGANRLEGAPSDTQMAVAIISAGPDMTFQTQCNAFVDANTDNVPDVPLVNKPGGSDDIVLGHTYAEASAALGGLWGLKSGAPDTATIAKDIEVDGDASFGGSLILGGGLLLPDQTTSGACAEANDQQLRRNTSGPSLEICVWGGGPGAWVPMGGAGAISGLTAATAPNTINNLAHLQTWNWNSATTGSGLALGSNSLTSGSLVDINVSNAASTGTALMLQKNSTAGGSVLQVVASGGTGVNTGVYTQVMSTSGTGVAGLATAASGTTYGVYGLSSSPSGYGAYGANAASGGTGVMGEAASGAATGVLGSTSSTTNNAAAIRGTASGASGLTYGVLGSSASATGFGVAGTSTATAGTGVYGVANTGAATGVLGATSSTTNNAAAVKGTAGGGTGTTYGGHFTSSSTSGTGVFGVSPVTGVWGQVTGTSGYGVYGETTCASCSARAIYGVSSSTSAQTIRGNATATTGSTYAGLFANDSTSGTGLYAEATTATGTTYGVVGTSQSSSGTGVAGTGGTYGVTGSATGAGVNFGVTGTTSSASGYGGYFTNTGSGWGLYTAMDSGIAAGKYLNWGTTRGTTGYGIWDDAGVMKVKNSGGSWTAIAGGAETDPQVGTLTNGKWCTTNGTVIDCTSDAPGGGGTAMSGITAAGGTNTINNAGHTQTWHWNSVTTGTGLALSSSSLTSGSILSVTASNASSSGSALFATTNATASNATAIRGTATGTSGFTYGGYFQSDSPSGRAVYAHITSTGGYGVYGYASASSGSTTGVIGDTASSSGRGVHGYASAAGGGTYGVSGVSASTSGRGVYGIASAGTGTTYGVHGTSASASGYAGYFDNTNAGGGWGLYTANDLGIGAGMYLNWGATRGSGGYGIRDNAGTIECKNSGGAWAACAGGGGGGAISALTAATGANTINNAAHTQVWNWNSVTSDYGLIIGSTSLANLGLVNVNVSNTASTGHALTLQTTSTSGGGALRAIATGASGGNIAVSAQVSSTSGIAVSGTAGASSGANYGIYGSSASSSGYGGYFTNTNGSGGWGVYSADDIGLAAGMYLNWGTTRGSTGYGIRDNAGTIECKNSGGAWAACAGGGGGGSPGGSNTQIQFNNSGAFGGSANLTWDGSTLTATGSATSIISGTTTNTGSGAAGVHGWAGGGSGNAKGVSGVTSSPNGIGVYGAAGSGSGDATGVHGQSLSPSGTGVYGMGQYAVRGETWSATGYAGYFDNMNAGGGWGVYTPDDLGVGAGKYMNFGATRGSSGYGIRDNAGTIEIKNSGGSWAAPGGGGGTPAGANTQLQFNNSGAFGASANLTWNGQMLSAVSTSGTYSVSANHSGSNGVALYGIAHSAATIGVYGNAAAPSGTIYGVYGSAASATGYAGYFDNTNNGWGVYSAAMLDSLRASTLTGVRRVAPAVTASGMMRA